jgi:hypothetical protein
MARRFRSNSIASTSVTTSCSRLSTKLVRFIVLHLTFFCF